MILTTLNKLSSNVEPWLRPMTERLMDGDYVALVMSYGNSYVFDAELAKTIAGKKIVIFEMGEYGVNDSWQNLYLPGITIQEHRQVESIGEFHKLDEFLKQQNVILCFKREFSAVLQDTIEKYGCRYPVEPIEIFFDNIPPLPTPNKEQYIGRHGLIFHLFGNSHPDRKALAGALMSRWERICTSLSKMQTLVNHGLPFSLVEQIEHLSRYEVQEVLHHQSHCLLSCNFPGYGQKAFRNREACFNAVPVMMDVGMRYSVSWGEHNAVMLPTENGRLKVDESVLKLEEALRDRENLWQRMLGAHAMAHAYAPDAYVRAQINEKIAKYL